MTLDDLAQALKGMPRDARMLIRLPDGTECDIAMVHTRNSVPGRPGYDPAQPGYSLILDVIRERS